MKPRLIFALSVLLILVGVLLIIIGVSFFFNNAEKPSESGDTNVSLEQPELYPGSVNAPPDIISNKPYVFTEKENSRLADWKKEVVSRRQVSEEYLDEHVTALFVSEERDNGFGVGYLFTVDWAKAYGGDAIMVQPVPDESTGISLTHPITKIISKADARKILQTKCHPSLDVDDSAEERISPTTLEGQIVQLRIPKNLRLGGENHFNGRLILNSRGEVDLANNKCKKAELDLESGELLSCTDQACYVY